MIRPQVPGIKMLPGTSWLDEQWKNRGVIYSHPRCFVEQLREQADVGDEFERPLRIILDERVSAGITQPSDGSRKHHHEACLFVAIRLVREIVELENRFVGTERLLHQGHAVYFEFAPKPHKIVERLDGC